MSESARIRCMACGHVFPQRQARVDGRDDRRCPACDSMHLRENPTRAQLLRGFLIEWNTY